MKTQTTWVTFRALFVFALGAPLVACCGSAVQGQAVHPPDGGKNSVDYCAKASSQENNCMACASKPGCGYCATSNAGAPACQPGVANDREPGSCAVPLIVDNSSCSAPPPPLEE